MKKITIITDGCGGNVPLSVTENEKTTSYTLPAGTEIAVSDAVAAEAIAKFNCRVGYFVNDADDIDNLPITGIADGSYAFIMSTQKIRFLSEGSWQ